MMKIRSWQGLGERGAAALEAALIFPLAIFLMFACVELYQYFRAAALLDRAAFSVANGVALQRELYDQGNCTQANDICVYGSVVRDLLQPLDYAGKGGMIISAFAAEEPDGLGNVTWKTSYEWTAVFKGDGPTAASPVSRLTDTSAFPQARVGDTVIVAEMFLDYEPFAISKNWWQALAGTKALYSRFFFRPRFEDLRVLQ